MTVDLERERDLCRLFEEFELKRVLEELSVLKRKQIRPGRTLLFLDEIQACPKVLAAMRYFRELIPDLHVVAADSLLDFALREFEHSMPVGRIEFLHLQPMSFEEFLAATGNESLVDYINGLTLERGPSAAVETKIKEALRRYFFVGGMPEAVHAFSLENDLLEVQRIQTGLVETLEADFAKYGQRRLVELMRRTYSYVATNVGRKVKFVNISREDRSAEVRRALELLTLSRVIQPVVHSAANGLPLGVEKDDRHFKSLFLDIGLVNRMCGLDLTAASDLITVNEGALAEQFVGQQLLCDVPSFEDPRLFYWIREARNANAEVDFLVGRGQEIYPIEVKAGKAGTLRSALQFLREKRWSRAVRFYSGPIALDEIDLPGDSRRKGLLLSLPLYAVGQLDRFLKAI